MCLNITHTALMGWSHSLLLQCQLLCLGRYKPSVDAAGYLQHMHVQSADCHDLGCSTVAATPGAAAAAAAAVAGSS